jgi:hypothetical protein
MKTLRYLLSLLFTALLPGCVTMLEDYRAEYSFAPTQVDTLREPVRSALAETFGAANVTSGTVARHCTFRIADPDDPVGGTITVTLVQKLPPLRPVPFLYDINGGRSAILVEKPGRELTDRVRRVHEAIRRVLDESNIEWYFQIIYQE